MPALGSIVGVIALAARCWLPPVDAPVVDPYRAPACRWCPGHRGLEYGTASGTRVRAVERGTVTFAGSVAGTRYVVVRHPDGRRATYGRLASATVATGQAVAARQVVGVTGERLYFGLRDGTLPVDPSSLLGRVARPIRLVPIDGTGSRPAPVVGPVCARGNAPTDR